MHKKDGIMSKAERRIGRMPGGQREECINEKKMFGGKSKEELSSERKECMEKGRT